MKTILLPSDFSDNAWNAMCYANEFFKGQICNFIILNTYYPAPSDINAISVDYIEPYVKSSQKELEKELNKFSGLILHPDSTIEKKSIYGELTNVIKNLRKEIQIDYVVMGTKGAGGVKEILIGSNTALVAAQVTCPMICVPENSRFVKPENMVFSSDFDDVDNTKDLLPLKELAKRFSSKIKILIIRNKKTVPVDVHDAKDELELEDFFQGIEHEIYIRDNDDVEKGILEFVENNTADMIVSLKRKHDFWEKLFTRSVTKKLTFHTKVPMLILHESED